MPVSILRKSGDGDSRTARRPTYQTLDPKHMSKPVTKLEASSPKYSSHVAQIFLVAMRKANLQELTLYNQHNFPIGNSLPGAGNTNVGFRKYG